MALFKKIYTLLSMIKFHHSIFALPFAFLSYFWATEGKLYPKSFILVLLAMVSARNVAMTANRIIDYQYDIKNPRTMNWPYSRGEISKRFALNFVTINILIFETVALLLNRTCFFLSPIALFFLIFYSYSKRFTIFCHLILGFTDGLAPIGAYIAVKEKISVEIVFLSLAVTFFVAGFDILYSIQDVEFDKKEGLKSFPVKFGVKKSLKISFYFHLLTIFSYLIAGILYPAGFFYFLSLFIVVPLFFYEHSLIKPEDLSKLNKAFFTVNGYISVFIFFFSILDFVLRGR